MGLVATYCLFLLLWHRRVGVGHGASMDFFGFLVRAARVAKSGNLSRFEGCCK